MYLQSIKLTQFKNYDTAQFEFDSGFNVITGNNGVGKTNLIDSIYYICMTKSFFGGADKNSIQKGADFCRIEAHFVKELQEITLAAKIQSGKKKVVEKNGKVYEKLSDHIGRFPIIMVAPDDSLMVTGGSEERRRFADTVLSQKDAHYLTFLMRYNRVLKQRNALLKQSKGQPIDAYLLSSYNDQLMEPAHYLYAERKKWTTELIPIFNHFYQLISEDKEQVGIQYISQLANEDYALLLDQYLDKDRILERTTVGIHKDDWRFKIDDMPVKRFASQGQRKSFTLALKLAQYQLLESCVDHPPILLMDDIFDKLDQERAKNLLSIISTEGFGQVFITDTHRTRVSELLEVPHQVIHME